MFARSTLAEPTDSCQVNRLPSRPARGYHRPREPELPRPFLAFRRPGARRQSGSARHRLGSEARTRNRSSSDAAHGGGDGRDRGLLARRRAHLGRHQSAGLVKCRASRPRTMAGCGGRFRSAAAPRTFDRREGATARDYGDSSSRHRSSTSSKTSSARARRGWLEAAGSLPKRSRNI